MQLESEFYKIYENPFSTIKKLTMDEMKYFQEYFYYEYSYYLKFPGYLGIQGLKDKKKAKKIYKLISHEVTTRSVKFHRLMEGKFENP